MSARRATLRRYGVVLALLFGYGAAVAQENLDFEAAAAPQGVPLAWSFFGRTDDADAAIGADATTAASGARSLRVERTTNGVTRLAQRLPAAEFGVVAAERLRLTGAVRADAAAASLWLRVALPSAVLFVDSRGDGREADALGPAAPPGWRRFTLELPLPPEATEVAFGVAVRGTGAAWFDDLALVRTAVTTLPPATPAARDYVEDALAILEAEALGRPVVGWSALRQASLGYARGARTPSEAHLAVRYAIAALGDRHSYFQTPQATAALRAAAVANARTGQALAAPGAAALDGGVAYLAVPGFAGGAPTAQVEFAESIKKLIQLHDSSASCGWVLDLRQNGGGNLWPMLAGVGPLLGNGPVGASVYPDGRRVPVWYRDGQAGFGDYVQLRVNDAYRPARLPAVAVLTGPGTGSSAEVLALAFRGRADARSFGAPTAGLSTGTRTFALADGAALVLAVAATSDRLGRVYTGPLDPDEAVPSETAARDPAADALVAAAQRWLRARDICRTDAL